MGGFERRCSQVESEAIVIGSQLGQRWALELSPSDCSHARFRTSRRHFQLHGCIEPDLCAIRTYVDEGSGLESE